MVLLLNDEVRVTDALHQVLRQGRAVCLNRIDRRRALADRHLPEVIQAAEVDREIGGQRNQVVVHAELDVVGALGNGEIVEELPALFCALT